MKKHFPLILFVPSFLTGALSLQGQGIKVSVQPTSTNESSGTAQITLALSAPAGPGAAVTASIVGLSASNADYTGPASTRISFAPGAQTANFTVNLTNDNLAEPNETFHLELSNPTGVTIPETNSTHTIVSDDAGLVLTGFFADGMVMQRNKNAPVWGFSLPGSVVTATFAGQTRQATTDANGRFEVIFTNLSGSSIGRPLVISSPGVPTRTINDVVVGEVWLAAGQSNMDFPLNFLPSPENDNEIATSNDPLLRIFIPTQQASPEPAPTVGGNWFAATPGDTPNFPALAYYVGERLRVELGVPVAFIECAWGGQPIEGFISEEKLEAFPEGNGALGTRDFFYNLFETGQFDSDPRFLPNLAGQLFNGMIAPMAGYGIRGMFWYQGEANALSFNSDEYEPLITNLAQDLRSHWDEDLPFYYVQLPNFLDPGRSLWINVQNAQRLALKNIPNSGMMVGNDIGDINDIHPVNKSEFADRLVRWPLSQVYGQSSIVPSGPLFRSASREGSSITVSFDYAQGLNTRNGGNAVGGFELRDGGGEWFSANAIISGQTVVVTTPSVSAPVGVRYAWEQNPSSANLINGANLPASIFDAVPTVDVNELYRDTFNDTSIGINADSSGGLLVTGTAGDTWVESFGQIAYSGAGGGNRANVRTSNAFGIDQGFNLEVDYFVSSISNGTSNDQFSFGLFSDYVPSNLNSLVATAANGNGIGFSIDSGTASLPEGLTTATSGTTRSLLRSESAFTTDAGPHRLSLTVLPNGSGGARWSYSYDGGVPVTGNIAVFDFTSTDYQFVAHGRNTAHSKSIQQVRLTTFETGLPILTVSAEPTNEGLIGLFVDFTLSQPSTSTVSVRFDTVDGIALEGQDYLPFTNRVITFAPGETKQTELLTMVDDAVIEPDETFSLALSDPIGLALAQSSAQLIIINDDTVLDDFGDSHGLVSAQRAILSDDDNDGIPLFLEFAFNLDPTVANSPDYVPGAPSPFNGEPFGLPTLTPVFNPSTGETDMIYRYIRRIDSTPKITYFTETSSDGVNFVVTEPDTVTRVSTFWDEVIVVLGSTGDGSNSCFARVRVEAEDDDGDGF